MVMPKEGIVAVPRQLAARLPPSVLRTGAAVDAVDATGVTVEGTRHEHDKVVLAVPQHVAAELLNITTDPSERRTTTMVYATDAAPLQAARLLLNGEYDPATSPVLHVHVRPSCTHVRRPAPRGRHLARRGRPHGRGRSGTPVVVVPRVSPGAFRSDRGRPPPHDSPPPVGRDHLPVDVDGGPLGRSHHAPW
ncbi:MAG: hypothetical protein CM15mP128_2110 [Methanobacteriota archaeon]|nr:MAG: hypothetical protein CM15mP128_2110 [Euryarchaeota archaeon]